MKPLRSWAQAGILFAVSTWTVSQAALLDGAVPTPPVESRPAAVSPDVDLSEPSIEPPKPVTISTEPKTVITPEPEFTLPTTTATPPTGDTLNPLAKKAPMDLNEQFEVPLEVNPQSKGAEAPRSLFSNAPVTTVPSPQLVVEKAAPAVAEEVDPLLKLVNEAIEVSGRRYLTAEVHTPWQIIHGLLAYRQDFQLKTKDGRKINALEWASSGVSFQGEPLFQRTPFGGRAHPFIQAYWFEGHPTQFMAYLTMCRLPKTHQFKTPQGEVVTVADIISNAKMEVNRQEEMTWTLWALAHYLEPDAQWINKKSEPWSMEELVKFELQNTIYDGPCGGTHSLFATAYARNSYLMTKKPLRGVWLEADQKVQRFVAEARSLQNGDGSFSIHFFKGPGASNDFNTRITSSGHMIEWLMVALPQSRLSEPWIRNGVQCLAQDLINNRQVNAECGPLYHAVDGLQIYRERMQKAAGLAMNNNGAAANGWKPAPSNHWPQPKILANGGQLQESNSTATAVKPQVNSNATTIRVAPGVEIVIPRRARPAATATQPSNTVRQ